MTITVDTEALEKAAETHWNAINTGSRSPWAEVEEPIRDEIRALIRADIAAYLDALVESGRAKACHAWVSDSEGIFDADFEPIEGTVPAIIILDGDA